MLRVTTGKTATVHQVLRSLESRSLSGDLRPFRTIELNGTMCAEPADLFVHLWRELSGRKLKARQAEIMLDNHFRDPPKVRMHVDTLHESSNFSGNLLIILCVSRLFDVFTPLCVLSSHRLSRTRRGAALRTPPRSSHPNATVGSAALLAATATTTMTMAVATTTTTIVI